MLVGKRKKPAVGATKTAVTLTRKLRIAKGARYRSQLDLPYG
jgi:hypothetical protein